MGSSQQNNVFLQSSLPSVFLKTAAPIILIMLVNGSFTLVDAYFLGVFVGADALTAVTSMFPIFIFLIALSTLVSNGFSSVMARQLGAGDLGNAVDTFASGDYPVDSHVLSFDWSFLSWGQRVYLIGEPWKP